MTQQEFDAAVLEAKASGRPFRTVHDRIDGPSVVYLSDGEIAAAALASAAAAAERRIPLIEAARDAKLLEGVTWNGKDWHIDQVFQAHITGLVAAFAAGILPPGAKVGIRTRANVVEQLDFAQIKALAGAVLLRVQAIWAESWAAKDAPQ